MKIIVFMLFLSMGLSAFAQGGGGATTVGDGGYVVMCKSTEGPEVRLLDLFEASAMGHVVKVSLGDHKTPMLEKVWIGLERLQKKIKLEDEDVNEMLYAADRFLRFPYDPWENGKGAMFEYFLRAKNPIVKKEVSEKLRSLNCRVEVAVIRPDMSAEFASKKSYASVCNANFAGFNYCFLMNTKILRKMTKNEKACLIIHEVLRFLPPEKKFKKDAELRRHTYFACTGKTPP